MKYVLLFLTAFVISNAYSQENCVRKSPLFRFEGHIHPRVFTEKLGNHPQLPFLQQEKGVVTTALFIKAAKSAESRKSYPNEFYVFNELLHEIGFENGYQGLKASCIRNLFINPGTIGNLGFFHTRDESNGYIYVQLNPAGESDKGIAAWKITGPGGCYIYILHTCGNAFYPDRPVGDCCKDLTVSTQVTPLELNNTAVDRPLHIKINFYQGRIFASGRHKDRSGSQGRDTLVKLIRSIDTITTFRDTAGKRLKIYANDVASTILVCRDTILQLHTQLLVDSGGHGPDSVSYILSDTSYITEYSGAPTCRKKWEISADGGASFNSVPRFDNTTVHSRTNGAQVAAELAISRIFNHWFQAGISASYITLSYQDDVAYPGSVAGTYNTVYVGKPLIPVQLFGKATIGGPPGWQSNVSLSAGFSIPTKSKIENSGNTLSTKPDTKGGLTAGFKLGIAYFFSCKFGLGLSFSGQYFNNSAATMNYHLVALPITLGIRYRF